MVTRKEVRLHSPEVEWYFMGVDLTPRRPGIVKIHEYSSSSLPPLRRLKDSAKRFYNVRPDFRLFLNGYVQQQFNFRDEVPFGFRDMGITEGLLLGAQQTAPKEYDFIYCGSVTRDIRFHRILDRFLPGAAMAKSNILVLSMNFQHLADRYSSHSNIIFKGPVQHEEVGQYLQKARFAINYKPDIEPHNHQTVTKLLEYAACRIPILTSDLAWVRYFEQTYGGCFFYFTPDFSNFTMEILEKFPFQFPDLSTWIWEQQLKSSG
ncbi:hypothetical protein [Paraflavitalea speifideaquila]|uniref:hypothetical protein n=1 Tax=Paraflavitalea speifideaquila TaxID=3076558 RepID=UPI0028F1210D|nr:hypothetical protein [Paraflavitalea speifideiaquila]